MGRALVGGVAAALAATLLPLSPSVAAETPPPTAACAAERFADVAADHQFAEDICWTALEEISTGYPGTPLPTYRPAAVVTRQAMSAFMYRLAGSPAFTDPGGATFADVPAGHEFFSEIEWMAAEEISEGYPGTPQPTFQPGAPVSRQAMSAFMYRLAGSPAFTDPGAATFADVPAGHGFFTEIEWMAAVDMSEGYPGTPQPTFQPGAPVTRQAMSAFMRRLVEGPGVHLGEPPPAALPSDAYANRNWTPTVYDTCPSVLHNSYSVVGPDGRLYPTWHPPQVTDPATGQLCTFGHEHGADPALSEISGWVAEHLAAEGYEDRAGIPFGYANEALISYAADNPGVPTRFEDHVGHKISFANNVRLLDTSGRSIEGTDPSTGAPVQVTCDYFLKVHQGSHSSDATGNNLHELIYAARCNDGTEVLATTMTSFGAANEFNRSSAAGTTVAAGTAHPFEDGGGVRLLPDRGCIEQYVLVSPANPAANSDIWALYESWQTEEQLTLPGGEGLASYDPWFAVRNPSRYFNGIGSPVARTLDAAWQTDPADNGVVNREPWLTPASGSPYPALDPRSPFNGAQRDFYLAETQVQNSGGATRWYTDPMGGNASTEPFPGAICQIVSATDNTGQPLLKRRLFGRTIDYGATNGVHAPN